MIEVVGLTKRYGEVLAVDAMSFTVTPGRVTGFVGPNGAGKSTTMRTILGLDRPTSGTAAVNGRSYVDSRAPIAEVGALLDAQALDKSRSARNHLRAIGATVGISARRVDEVLDLVGLTEVAHKSAGSFSLGMGQRLGIAAALLADPGVIMLDEPVNGLDPDGIRWIRDLLRNLAAEGRTVFVSSHLMSEMELTADHLVVVGRGKVIADQSMASFIDRASQLELLVRTPEPERLIGLLPGEDIARVPGQPGSLVVRGVRAEHLGDLAMRHAIALHQLASAAPSLEEAYMELTRTEVDYHASPDLHHRKAA